MIDRLGNDWHGRKAVIVGGGPSLAGFNFAALKNLQSGGVVVVAVNDAMLACPFADAVLSVDKVWVANRAAALAGFAGEKIAAVGTDMPVIDGVRLFARNTRAELSANPSVIATGGNSGFAALGMAMMRGAARIALLGFDLKAAGHFHAGYAWRSRYGAGHYAIWARNFSVLAIAARRRGTDVINCNPDSAIRCFRFAALKELEN